MRRLGAVGVVLLFAASCLDEDGARCADGTLCPGLSVCAPAGGCASEAALTACHDHADGDACDAPGLVQGVCVAEVCVEVACGNHYVDDGEACDDGNTVGGDGCSAACDSDESCGNGRVDAGEQCDCGATEAVVPSACSVPNGELPTSECRSACTLPRCGNGVVDPIEACDDGNLVAGDGCSSNCTSNETCGNAVVDAGEQCDDGNLADSDGCQHTCVVQRCGDGIVDPAEVCDDGNLAAGDGCTPDCASDETCGNGILDFFADERCDDGNPTDRDGCTQCTDDEPRWTRLGARPPGRRNIAMAYDPRRAEVVLFGGAPFSGLFDDTWTWNGAVWTQQFPASSPSPRARHALAYDPATRSVLLFGGYTDDGGNNETWIWDGNTWLAQTPAVSPPAHFSVPALGLDASVGRLITIAGGATWQWTGSTWEDVSAAGPGVRLGPAVATDPARGRTTLFAGDFAGVNDTWEWDGAAWAQRSPGLAPPRSYFSGMTWVPGLGSMVHLSGNSSGYPRETWTWSGSAWTQRAAGTSTLPGQGFAMATDGDGALVFGGDAAGDTARDSMWRWNGSAWSEARFTDMTNLATSNLVADPPRGEAVIVNYGQTWTWSGRHGWRSRGSSPLQVPALAFDPATQRVLAHEDTGINMDTWAWSGAEWTLVDRDGTPRVTSHTLATDWARGEVIRFGGFAVGGAAVDQTWAWRGDQWIQLSPATSPPARGSVAMAWDPRTAQVTLFGGFANGLRQSGTWTWDGTTWTDAAPAASPSGRYGAGMTYEPHAQQLLLFAGSTNGGANGETWRWDGTTWHQLAAAASPSARANVAMVYDPTLDRVVVFGGTDQAALSETWTFAYENPLARAETCAAAVDLDGDGLAGCADPDCWRVCTPTCPPGTATCPVDAPTCGDGTCDGIETSRICPSDCAAVARCGDAFCDSGESLATCPGDCVAPL